MIRVLTFILAVFVSSLSLVIADENTNTLSSKGLSCGTLKETLSEYQEWDLGPPSIMNLKNGSSFHIIRESLSISGQNWIILYRPNSIGTKDYCNFKEVQFQIPRQKNTYVGKKDFLNFYMTKVLSIWGEPEELILEFNENTQELTHHFGGGWSYMDYQYKWKFNPLKAEFKLTEYTRTQNEEKLDDIVFTLSPLVLKIPPVFESLVKDVLSDGVYEYPFEDASRIKVETWKNGKLINKKHYFNSELDGLYEEYDSKGNLSYRVTFKNGLKDGFSHEFHADGAVVIKKIYKMGQLVPLGLQTDLVSKKVLNYAKPLSIEVISEVAELKFSYLNQIPQGPLYSTSYSQDNIKPLCGALLKPKTLNGRVIAKNGWGVMSELSVGPFEFISFAGEFNHGTSGMCFNYQGNVAIFKLGHLIGVIYTTSKEDTLVGKLSLVEGGVIRLHSVSDGPWADIKILKRQIKIQFPASIHSFCSGTALVPNVVYSEIVDARKNLIDFAWKPIVHLNEELGREKHLRDSGIVETDSCSGTGRALCRFEYESSTAYLKVITAGEADFPIVIGYSVSCK